jgi:hypothetical protein
MDQKKTHLLSEMDALKRERERERESSGVHYLKPA